MQIRVQKCGYALVVMIASPLLALSLEGVGRASTCSPMPSNFFELDKNIGQNSSTVPPFDWAKSGANNNGCLTSTTQTTPINCSGSGGLFNGGTFIKSTEPPIPPAYIGTDPSIVAHVFGVDPLSVDRVSRCSVTFEQFCDSTHPCPSGETCLLCPGGDPTVFTKMGGEKNGDTIESETWATGSVENKDDISNIYAISHQVPVNADLTKCTQCTMTPDPSCAATSEVFVGFERVVNNGDSHVDFEFLQDTVSMVPSARDVCAGGFTGHRTPGDFLISEDFTKGGTIGNPIIHRWVCGGTSTDANGHCDPLPSGTKPPPGGGPHYQDLSFTTGTCSDAPTKSCTDTDLKNCADPTTAICIFASTGRCSNDFSVQCATNAPCTAGGGTCLLFATAVRQKINDGGPVGCGGWACRNADGTLAAKAGPPVISQVNTNEFYEIGVDLGGIGFTGCINSFLPHTRSSQAFTATTKDFQLLQFNTCFPSTKLTKTASATSVVTGDSVTYTYTEKNDGNVALTSPCPSATDKRSCFVTDDTCSGVTYQSGDTTNNNVLDPGETWTFTCTRTLMQSDCPTPSNMCTVTNTATGHGIFTPPGSTVGKDVTFCADPTMPPDNTICDQDEQATFTVTVLTPRTSLAKNETHSVKTTVNYTYAETNDGKVALITPAVVDDKCSPVTYDSGDTDGNSKLDPGETWTFKCTKVFDGTGPFTNTAVPHGCFTSGGKTKDVTFGTAASACGVGSTVFPDKDETATKTVNAGPVP